MEDYRSCYDGSEEVVSTMIRSVNYLCLCWYFLRWHPDANAVPTSWRKLMPGDCSATTSFGWGIFTGKEGGWIWENVFTSTVWRTWNFGPSRVCVVKYVWHACHGYSCSK
jgi:hypothetical protein